MKKQSVTSTNGPAFFKLLAASAQPLSNPTGQTSVHPDGGLTDKRTRLDTSASASEKHDGKSHEPSV
jgi:hypothetical protein